MNTMYTHSEDEHAFQNLIRALDEAMAPYARIYGLPSGIPPNPWSTLESRLLTNARNAAWKAGLHAECTDGTLLLGIRRVSLGTPYASDFMSHDKIALSYTACGGFVISDVINGQRENCEKYPSLDDSASSGPELATLAAALCNRLRCILEMATPPRIALAL